jgi:glycerol-3-phosphate dehydrogenase
MLERESMITAKRSSRAFQRDLKSLTAQLFDLLVIGGGSIGTAVARDAALRGMSVALIESEDYGSGTVSRSTRLAHGGLRYLEMRDFRLVREALREREILLKIAPHLVSPLPFLTPIYRGDRWSPLMVATGMLLYDLLSFDKSLPGHRFLTVAESLRLGPDLRRASLLGGALYYDAQIRSPERLCLAQARSAAEAGAVCANHVVAAKLTMKDDRIIGVSAEDRLAGKRLEIRARITVNAAGPWAGDIAPGKNGSPRLRRTQGVHLIVPRFTDHAIVLLAQRDGRVFFVVPWKDRSMIGTTDTDFTGDPRDAKPSEEDIRYLLDETRRTFPHADLAHVEAAFAGVRPLLPNDDASESQVTREHRIVDHADEGRPGLISVFGGKLTTARDIGEQIVDLAARTCGVTAPCRTDRLPLWGGDLNASVRDWERWLIDHDAPADHAAGWVSDFGSQSVEVLNRYRAFLDEGGSSGLPPAIEARFSFGVEEEMALTVSDLMLRRSLLGYEASRNYALARTAAEWLGRRFSRTPEQVNADLEDYERQADLLSGDV